MALMRFSSWNVNGFRAVSAKPDWAWFAASESDVIGLQETKVSPEQLTSGQREPEGWHAFWASSTVKKGYSGVAVFSRRRPLAVEAELPDPDFQGEGRVLHLEFPELHFFNIYFPNGGEEVSKGVFRRVPYKMGFFNAFSTTPNSCARTSPSWSAGTSTSRTGRSTSPGPGKTS